LYLDASSNSALLNKSYSYYFDVVENLTSSDWFKNQIGDVHFGSTAQKINPIGSEIAPPKA